MVRIVTLMDNTCGSPDSSCEHGLSFYVERDGRAVLFDTGMTGSFMDNAERLNVDAGSAEALVISHGHYDHGGGVRSLFDRTSFRGTLWTGDGFFDKKWSDDPGGPRYLGVDFDESYLTDLGIPRKAVSASDGETAFREALPGIFVVGGFPRSHGEESNNPRFVVDRDGGRVIDDFRDEICLVIDSGTDIAVVLGCAHPGLMNMVDAVRSLFGSPVRAVFGGSHLVEADVERIEATCGYLAGLGNPLVALGHCTGRAGAEALGRRLPSFRPLAVGSEFRL